MRDFVLPSCLVRPLVIAVLATMVSTAFVALPSLSAPAHAAEDCDDGTAGNPKDEAQLKKVSAERQQIQKDLQALLNTGEVLRAEIGETKKERKELRERQRRYDAQAGDARSELRERIRSSYMRSNTDPVLTILTATDAQGAVEQSRVLGMLAEGSRARAERANSAAQRNLAAAEHADRVNRTLSTMQDEYGGIKKRTASLLEQAKEEEARVSAKVALQRAANGSNCPLPAGTISGGLACPVDQPRSYTDTWGAPRSGGRVHMGVDILAPIGTPQRAYEAGVITRMHSNSLGGISLYLRGNSGNEYYYTHLSGYVSGLSVGQRVTAGQHIAFTGDTGNAAGIPHLHWEVRPGGGANVNPYPYALRACG